MKSFNRIERKRLPEMVADEIEEAIIDGTFVVNTQLPSEQHLATQFGVSRNVVREAFKYLKERGLIEILNGSGAYVLHPSGEATSSALGRYIRLLGAHESIQALYEARRILEGWNARLAAQRATEDDLQVLASCLKRMEAHAGSIEKWSEADLDFHLAVAKSTHNPFLSVLLEPLVDQLRGVIAEGYIVPGAAEGGLRAHIDIYNYIKARDSEGAYTAIIKHLGDSESRVHEVESGKNQPMTEKE